MKNYVESSQKLMSTKIYIFIYYIQTISVFLNIYLHKAIMKTFNYGINKSFITYLIVLSAPTSNKWCKETFTSGF